MEYQEQTDTERAIADEYRSKAAAFSQMNDGKATTVIDNDTAKVLNKPVRFYGVNAPEITQPGGAGYDNSPKWGSDQGVSGLYYKAGADLGYTKPINYGTDAFGRQVVDYAKPDLTSLVQGPDKKKVLSDFATTNLIMPVSNQTSPELANKAIATKALADVLPDWVDGRNEYLSAGINAYNEARVGAKVIPKYVAQTPQELAALSSQFSNIGAGKLNEQIDFFRSKLKDPSITKPQIDEVNRQINSLSQQLYSYKNSQGWFNDQVVANPLDDRTVNNKSLSPWSDSIVSGGDSLVRMIGGVSQLAGDSAKIDYLSDLGRKMVLNSELRASAAPSVETSPIDAWNNSNGPWSKIYHATSALSNNIVGAIPLIAGIMVGTTAATAALPLEAALGATAGGLLTSTGVTFLPMLGQSYADQPIDHKDPLKATGIALAEALLFQVGLKNMGGAIGVRPSMFNLAERNAVADMMVGKTTADGIILSTRAEALKYAEDYSIKSVAQLANMSSEVASKQLMTKEAMLRAAAGFGVAAGEQSAQMAAQHALSAYNANNGQILDPTFQHDYYKNMLDSALVGIGFAGAHDIPAFARRQAEWHSVVDAKSESTKTLNDKEAFVVDNAAKLEKNKNTSSPEPAFTDVKDGVDKANLANGVTNAGIGDLDSNRGFWTKIKGLVTSPLDLFRSSLQEMPAIREDNGNFRPWTALMRSIMGPDGTLPGAHAELVKQAMIGRWTENTGRSMSDRLGVSEPEASRMVMDAFHDYWSKGDAVPENYPHSDVLQKFWESEEATRAEMKNEANKQGITTSALDTLNNLFESATINPTRFKEGSQRVMETMMNNGATRKEASEAIRNLVSGDANLGAAAREKLSNFGVFKDKGLSDLFESNVFHNLHITKEHMAGSIMHKMMYGEGGNKLAKILELARGNGEFDVNGKFDENLYKDTVATVQKYHEIVTGQYHTMEDVPFIKSALGWGVLATMMSSLGKAALSSLVELPMSMLGTGRDGMGKQAFSFFRELMPQINEDMRMGASVTLSKIGISALRGSTDHLIHNKLDQLNEDLNNAKNQKQYNSIQKEIEDLHQRAFGYALLKRLGYEDSGYNSQAKYELADSKARKVMSVFARVIGLRAITDSTRLATLSVAADLLAGHMQVLIAGTNADPVNFAKALKGEARFTVEQRESMQFLRDRGIDPIEILNFISENGEQPFTQDFITKNANNPAMKKIMDNIFVGITNLVNDKVVHPQAWNTPTYQFDPRLRMITAMTRFTSTATSQMLPKLYKQYIKDGNVGMRYEAFAVIGMALAMGMITNEMKDVLSYGTTNNPYIKTTKGKIQRTINASGLIGSVEKISDFVSPIYPNTTPKFTKDPIGNILNNAEDISPVASWTGKLVRGANLAATGNSAAAAGKFASALPLVGSFKIPQQMAMDAFKGNK